MFTAPGNLRNSYQDSRKRNEYHRSTAKFAFAKGNTAKVERRLVVYWRLGVSH